MALNRMSLEFSDQKDLSLSDFVSAATSKRWIAIESATLANMDRAFGAAKHKACGADLYGVTTGLGPLVAVDVPADAAVDMQYNLIRSHAAGMGEPLAIEVTRGLMLARLQSLTRNRSAVRGAVAAHIASLFNAGLTPIVPRKGGVGASGDLVQLAHFGLLMIGEGPCMFGARVLTAREAYSEVGMAPLRLEFRDGLALVNGVSAMVSMGAFAVHYARRLFDCAIAQTCVLIEILGASEEAYAEPLLAAKRHQAQCEVARQMRQHLAGARQHDRPLPRSQLQAPYSVRCAPQIIGPFYEALEFAEGIIGNELNSTSDNPVFDAETGAALHGGNFHGDAVATALDVMKIAVVKCSLLMERQLNLLLNDSINGKLPPFLNLGRLGADLGLQGAQFTAASTAAENQSMAFPMSVHSIPTNKDNQDIVSMGANAAWMTLQCVDNAFDIAAILAVALSQGVEGGEVGERLSPHAALYVAKIRRTVPVFKTDSTLSSDFTEISRSLKLGD
jgi:histidine ammonia-lyase